MKQRRTKLVVDRDFQLKFMVMSVVVMIIAINSVVLVGFFLSPLLAEVTAEEMLPLAGVELAALGIVLLLSLRQSHRIAGPLFALERGLERLGNGDLTVQVRLRRKDHFHDLAQSLNASVSRLRANVEGVKDTVGELRDTIRRGESPDELLGRLGSELERLTTGESGSEGPTPPRRRENAKEATPTVDPVVSTEGRLETKVA